MRFRYINLVLLSIGFVTLALFATTVFIVRLHYHLTSETTIVLDEVR